MTGALARSIAGALESTCTAHPPCIAKRLGMTRPVINHGLQSQPAIRSCTSLPANLQPAVASRRELKTAGGIPKSFRHLAEISRPMPGAVEVEAIQLPELVCSSAASMLNPHYEQVRQECDSWIEAVAQPPSASAAHFLQSCLLPRLVCRFIPLAPLGPALLHAIKLIAWLMIADDVDDNPDLLGSNSSATANWAALVMAILNGEEEAAPSDLFHTSGCVRLVALSELWQEMRRTMSPSLRTRFTSSMADYFEGLKMQASLRESLCVPDVESYMEIRRQASFTIPCFILMEYATGIHLDKDTLEDENILELQNNAVDYISLCNDIISCPIEISLGDYFNLPSILCASDTPQATSTTIGLTSFQSIIDSVGVSASKADARCHSLITTIRTHYSSLDTPIARAYSVQLYTTAIALGMAGALTWFHETARYQKNL